MPTNLRPRELTRGRRFAMATIVSLVAIAVSLYTAEGLLTWFFQERSVPASERASIFYPLGPEVAGQTLLLDQVEYSIVMTYNRMGFRGHDFPPPTRASGEYRIVYVGDSFVEGIGVTEDQRFSALVQAELDRQPGRFSTVNLGQAGTDPINYLTNLANVGIPLQPQLVVLGLYLGNDFEGAAKHPVVSNGVTRSDAATELSKRPANHLKLAYVRLLLRQPFQQEALLVPRNSSQQFWERLYRRSIDAEMIRDRAGLSEPEMEAALARIDKDLVAATIAGRLNPGSLVAAIRKDRAEVAESLRYSDQDFDAVLSVVLECQRLCAGQGATLLVLLIPDMAQVAPETFFRTYRRWGFSEMPYRVSQLVSMRTRMAGSLTEHDISFIDLLPALAALGDGGYYPLDRHLTPEGHRCAADAILNHPAVIALQTGAVDIH